MTQISICEYMFKKVMCVCMAGDYQFHPIVNAELSYGFEVNKGGSVSIVSDSPKHRDVVLSNSILLEVRLYTHCLFHWTLFSISIFMYISLYLFYSLSIYMSQSLSVSFCVSI